MARRELATRFNGPHANPISGAPSHCNTGLSNKCRISGRNDAMPID